MHKVLPLRSWTVLPTVAFLIAASTQSAIAGHNNDRPDGWTRGNQFRAHSLSISPRAAESRQPRWSTFESASGVTRNISRRVDFDLGSTRANIILGSKLFNSQNSVTIDIAGVQKTLTANSRVTAAEYVAALQQLDGGQSLILGKDGQGVGGTFTLDSIDNAGRAIKASELVIPQGVTGVGNFGRTSDFKVVGNLVNDGNVYALSTNPASNLATISAKNVVNEANGVISSAVPTTVSTAYGSILPELNLRLRADNDITNKGSITSSGNLELIAGGTLTNGQGGVASAANNVSISVGSGTVTNSGTISSTNGNINFASSVSAQDLNVFNGGGTLQALNGDINFRDPSYSDVGNIKFLGGDLYSRRVNLNSGLGTADLGVDNVTGQVNVNAACTHITASSGDLNLGTMNLTGDPTFYSVAGNVTLSSSISTNGADLAIIAGGDVIMTAGSLVTSSASGSSGNVLIVAGANVTAPAAGSGNNDTTTTVTIANSANAGNGSAIGGKIDLSASTGISTDGAAVGSNAGNITMVAYSGSTAGSGAISLPTALVLSAVGQGGANGDVTLIAGGKSGTTINAGAISVSSGSQTGSIFISTSTPNITGGVVPGTISVLNGTVLGTSGAFTNGALQKSANASFGTLSVNNAAVTWHNGGSITVPVIAGTTKSVDFETAGDLNIGTSIFAAGGIKLIAEGNVRSTVSPIGISSASSTGNGGSIFISAGTVGKIGDVDFSTFPISSLDSHSTALNGSGGNIQITSTAFGFNGGRVLIPNSVTVLTGGSGTGNNGNLSILATSSTDPSTTISIGGIDTTGGAANGSGSILLSAPSGGITVNGLISTNSANINVIGFGNVLFNNQVNGNGNTIFNASAGLALQLGQITANKIIGTSQNISGSGILLNGGLTAPGGILLVSKIDIDTNASSFLLSTTSSSGDAGNLILIAGADFIQDSSTVQIRGASLFGGEIDLSTNPLSGITTKSTSTNGSGGSVTLVGYSGTIGQGRILINQSSSILTGGNGTGSNGDVSIVSGTNIGVTGIQIGTIDLTGSTKGGGTIALETAVPRGSVANPIDISIASVTPTQSFLGSNIFSSGDIATKFLTAPSGEVYVRSGRQVQLGSINVSAADSTSNGGLISVTTASSTVLTLGAGANSIVALTADGGSTSGDGGTYLLTNIGNGGINATGLSVPFVTNGKGGTVSLDATSGTLNVGVGFLLVNGVGSGDGGSLSLAGNIITPTALTLAANGIGGGNGGSIFVNQTGTATTIIDGTHLQLFATGASGGSITVQSGGDVSVDLSKLKVNPTVVNGNGGTIALQGGRVSNALGGTLVLDVSAQAGGTGNGGEVSVTQKNALAPMKVSAGDDFQFIANSGTLGGNGGTVVMFNNTDLEVDQSGVNVNPLSKNGNGGTIAMNVTGSSHLFVDGGLSALGNGTGTGGTIVLQTASANPFVVTNKSQPVNGVFGTLSVQSKKGASGVISLINPNGAISILDSITNVGSLNLIAGNEITINASLGGKKTTQMNITTSKNGFRSTNSKAVLTALDSINFNIDGTTGSVNIPVTFNSARLTFNGTDDAVLVNKSKDDLLINSSTAGGDFNLTTAGNIENGDTSLTGVALSNSAGRVTLTSSRGGIGTTGSFLMKAIDLSFNSKRGPVGITNSGALALVLEDSNAGGSINISSSSDISILGSVGTTKANVVLEGTGTARIVNGGGVVNGATVNLRSLGSSVGDLVNGAITTNAANLLASAQTTVNLIDNAKSVTLGNISTNNGDLTVKTGTATTSLNVAKNAVLSAVDGSIVLQQSNTTKGKIAVGSKSVIQTAGVGGGDVYIYIGSTLPAKVNPIASGSNIIVNNTMGQVFGGTNGITAKAPNNLLTTKGRDIVFSTGTLSSKNLVLGGGVQITADPPLR